jgi:DNA replication protein DnaC
VTLTVVANGSRAETTLTDCPRYLDFRVARRLENSGVDAVICRVKLSDLGASPEALECFAEFVHAGVNRRAPRKVQLLIEGQKASHYAVALFRNLMKHHQNASYKSVHLPTLIRMEKNAMTTKENSVIIGLLEFDVLIIDGVDAASLQNKYFFPEVKWLYERRRDQGLATIITSTTKVGEAFPGASVLRV